MAIQERTVFELYPSSDGEPMADNTKQWEWIVTIKSGIEALFRHDPDVFVAGDLLWYPVEGHPEIRRAPDAMVAFGRPKGHRMSYLQWQEAHVAPQVVFEILSPRNSRAEMQAKLKFYNTYGVEEYYLYDPDGGELTGWHRVNGQLQAIETIHGWVSPRLGVRFELQAGDLLLFNPDGSRFLSFVEYVERADAERKRADAERKRADAERERAERLAARLRALGVDPDEQ